MLCASHATERLSATQFWDFTGSIYSFMNLCNQFLLSIFASKYKTGLFCCLLSTLPSLRC